MNNVDVLVVVTSYLQGRGQERYSPRCRLLPYRLPRRLNGKANSRLLTRSDSVAL